jgi:hypothetical protein
MKKWKNPPIIKIYEALGAVTDGRVEVANGGAKVYSSSGNKFYTVSYHPDSRSIMSNDNGSFWQEYLGYPSIAYLMKIGILPYEEEVGSLLKNIQWKDINQQFKNDFDKTLNFILSSKIESEREKLNHFVNKIEVHIQKMDLFMLGNKVKPPQGY